MFTKITYLYNSVSYVEAEGSLDIHGAPDYLDTIKEHLKRKYVKELILEFSKISYVASIGIRVLLEIYKIMQEENGILKLKNVNEEVLHVFEMTGFDKFLTIENDSNITNEQEVLLEKNPATENKNNTKHSESNIINNFLDNITKTQLKDILDGLNKWHYQVASIIGCNSSDGSIESKIKQVLLEDENTFKETLKIYEKISNNEYVNEWTNQHIPFNEEIQQLFCDLIPELIDIRKRIKSNTDT